MALMVVFGTLFMYIFTLKGDKISRRESMMVNCFSSLLFMHMWDSRDLFFIDIYSQVHLPWPCFGSPKSWFGMQANTQQDVANNSKCVHDNADSACIHPCYTVCVPDRGVEDGLDVILGLAGTSMCLHECRWRWESKRIEESERWGRVREMV